jgi:type IV secretion system protein VirB9
MRRHLLAFLLSALVVAPAFAEQTPVAGSQDPRMRYVPYDPDQVVHLSTGAGATLVVSFAPTETVTAVAVTDSKDLEAMPRGNYLFFKSKNALLPEPVIVLTSSDTGTRRYVFEITTMKGTDLGLDNSNVYYSVQFTYPLDEAAQRREKLLRDVAAARQRREALWTAAEIQRVHDEMNNPFIGQRNWHYVAQGDRSLLPLEIFDNGYSTVFRFPGNVRIPSIFILNPDGQEATANFSVEGEYLIAGMVGPGWRLRDGNTVLCIWNRAYDPVGKNWGTGTVSPYVKRVVRTPPQ